MLLRIRAERGEGCAPEISSRLPAPSPQKAKCLIDPLVAACQHHDGICFDAVRRFQRGHLVGKPREAAKGAGETDKNENAEVTKHPSKRGFTG